MHITRLTAADAVEYRSLMLLAYEKAADAFTSTPEERAAEPTSWWANRIGTGAADARTIAFGAFHEGQLVGTVALEFAAKPKTRHKALLIGMFVSDAARRLGAGKALVRAAVEHARTRAGLVVMTLTVTDGNEPAIRLYESSGFKAFGTEPLAILTPSGFKSKVHMWLDLRQGSNSGSPVS